MAYQLSCGTDTNSLDTVNLQNLKTQINNHIYPLYIRAKSDNKDYFYYLRHEDNTVFYYLITASNIKGPGFPSFTTASRYGINDVLLQIDGLFN